MIYGFEPFIDGNSKILILGSFPSVKSREEGFYYGNKQNKFWKILAEYFKEKTPNSIEEKKAFLIKHNIALYDTVASCNIVGSMDSNIKDYTVGDICGLIRKYHVKYIILNGKKSFELYEKHFKESAVPYCYLPSTSPANVSFKKEIWFEKLNEIFNGLL